MYHLGTVQEGSEIYLYFSTAAADGGEESFSATLEQADFPVYKDGAVMTLDASTIVIAVLATGLYELTIDLSNDADFTTGSHYVVTLDASDETIDSQAVSAIIGAFNIETDSDQAMRQFREYVFPTATLTTQTGVSDNTQINLTGIVDAQAQDDLYNGSLGKLRDATDGQVYDVMITDFANTNLLGAMVALDAGVTLPTPASGDQFWFTGHTYANVNKVSGTDVTWSTTRGLAGTALPNAAADAVGGLPISDAGGLDLDAIKDVTDQLIAAQAEPSSVPAANATPLEKLAWLGMLARNKIDNDGSQQQAYADDGTTVVGTATVGESGGTVTRGEFG